MKKIALSFLFFIFSISFYSQETAVEMIEPHLLIEDVEYYFNTIETYHPNPYFKYPKSYADSMRAELLKELSQPKSKKEFIRDLYQYTDHIFDLHTGLDSRDMGKDIPQENIYLPYDVFIENNALWLQEGQEKKQIYKINDITAEDFLKKIYILTKADWGKRTKETFLSRCIRFVFYFLFGGYDEFKIEFADHTSIKSKATDVVWNYTYPNTLYELKLFPPFAWIQLNTFDIDLELTAFLDSAFLEIEKNNITTLFLDIRFNGGGSDYRAHDVIDYLFEGDYEILYGHTLYQGIQYGVTFTRSRSVESVFKGKVILLQSSNTASAAKTLSSSLISSRRGIIYGEPTADAAFGYSSSQTFTLPNSNLICRCAMGLYSKPGGKAYPRFEGLEPHIYHRWGKESELTEKDLHDIYKVAYDSYKYYFENDY